MKKILFATIAALLCIWSADAQIITGSSYSTSTETVRSDSRYQGELSLGYGLGGSLKDGDGDKYDAKYSRVFIETVHGMRIMPYLFAGVGVGVQYAYNSMWDMATMPAFIDLKGYYPVTDDFAPYVAVDLGYGIPLFGPGADDLDGGFYASYGIGLNYKKLNFGLGWQHQSFSAKNYDDSEGGNSFFLKIGLKF